MLLVDARALVPRNPDQHPEVIEQWTPVLLNQVAMRYPTWPAERVQLLWTNQQRLAWLRRLADEEVWTEVIVLTTPDQFNWWRLLPAEIEVLSRDNTRLTKSKRTRNLDAWALSALYGMTTKAQLSKATPKQRETARQLVLALSISQLPAVEEANLLPTDGVYTPVDINSFDEVEQEIIRHINNGGWWCWDTETEQAGENDDDAQNPIDTELVGLSISICPGTAWYFPVGHRDPKTNLPEPWNLAKQIVIDLMYECWGTAMRGRQRRMVGHNLKYDLGVLTNPKQRLPFNDLQDLIPLAHDTMLMAQVGQWPKAGLKFLAEHLLNQQPINFRKLTRGRSFAYVPLHAATVYAGQDADWPLRLLPQLEHRLNEFGVAHVYEREMAVLEYFLRIERRGVRADAARIEAHIEETRQQLVFTEQLFRSLIAKAGIQLPEDFNIGSNDQIAAVLFDPKPRGLGMPVLARTESGRPGTGEPVLNDLIAQGLAHPAVKVLLAWRGYNKLVTAFLTPIRSMIRTDGRVHANFRQCAAGTGRTACHSPNMQQVEKHLRDIFVGHRVASIDYSQVELRGLAAFFDEPKMIETFQLPRYLPDPENPGKYIENPAADIHGRTQREVGLPNRTKAKNFNFGKAFGAGEATLSKTAAMPRDVVRAFIDRYDAAYNQYTARLHQLQEEMRLEAKHLGYCLIRNWFGRVRMMPAPQTKNQVADLDRIVSNTPVQGGAADIIKWAMAEALPIIREAEQWGIYPNNMVHDELDFDCEDWTPQDRWDQFLRDMAEVMRRCNPFADRVPLDVDIEIGTSWADLRVAEWAIAEAAEAAAEQEFADYALA